MNKKQTDKIRNQKNIRKKVRNIKLFIEVLKSFI